MRTTPLHQPHMYLDDKSEIKSEHLIWQIDLILICETGQNENLSYDNEKAELSVDHCRTEPFSPDHTIIRISLALYNTPPTAIGPHNGHGATLPNISQSPLSDVYLREQNQHRTENSTKVYWKNKQEHEKTWSEKQVGRIRRRRNLEDITITFRRRFIT